MIWLALLVGFSMSVVAAKNHTYRLPGDLKPISYNLDIITDFKDFKFLGNVTIKVLCINATNKVVLHSSGLAIQGTPSLSGPGLSCDDCLDQSADTKNDFLIFKLTDKLKPGSEYNLNIPFKGELKGSLAGYYRSRYRERETNETKWLGVTQFEPSSARLAFPCFDEPEMKAKFTIRLAHEDKYSAISNMPVAKTTPMDDTPGWVWNEFQESVPMSTYLVAWLVSEFKYGEAPLRPNGVKFRIWARPDALDQSDFALQVGPAILKFFTKHFRMKYVLPKMDLVGLSDFSSNAMENWGMLTFRIIVSPKPKEYVVAIADFNFRALENWDEGEKERNRLIQFASDVGPKVLEFFENLFEVEYPLPKQDMAAIPDFDAGAMENWGLITYRETRLLYDPTRPSIREKEAVAYVIAHELAHQWFGNLVTMKWWTDLWLNEGFATYVGTLGVESVHPEFNFLNEASMGYLVSVLELDGLKSSHPISIKVGPPSEVGQIFDTISYKKGSTVIRMMHNFLGDSFKKGVTNYLKAHKFGNAEQDDLWASLTDQAHKDGVLPESMSVKQIMDSWTLQTGYPLLRVTRNYDDGTATVAQHRFLSTGDEESDKACWWFPLTFTSESEKNFNDLAPKQWLRCGEDRVQLGNLTLQPKEWLIVNLKLTGLARVLYDAQNYGLIIKTLNSDRFHEIDELNRAGLILDTFDFAERGDLSYETALRLVNYISRETSYIPLERGFSALGQLQDMLSRTPNYGIYKEFMRKILEQLYEGNDELFVLPEDIQQQKIHILLTKKFCKFGVGDCNKQAIEMYKVWAESANNSCPLSRSHQSHNQPSRPKTLDNAQHLVHAKRYLSSGKAIPFDLLSLVLCTAVKYGDEAKWDEVYRRYLTSNLASEKASFLAVLGCSREVWVLNRYLEWSLTEEHGIRKQDSIFVFSYVAQNDVGFHLAFDFLENNVKRIYDYNYPRTTKMGRYLLSLASKIMYQHELDRLKKFVETNAKYFEASKMAVQQSFEKAAINIKWHNTHYDNISRLLAR